MSVTFTSTASTTQKSENEHVEKASLGEIVWKGVPEKLSQCGVNITDAFDRFDGNAEFFKTLAIRYLKDEHYIDLVSALDVEDFDTGYKAAHALKGVAGNLSFERLYKAVSAISEALFEGEYQAAEKLMPELQGAQSQIKDALVSWEAGEI